MNPAALDATARASRKRDAPRSVVSRYWRLVVLSLVGWSLLAAIPTTSAYIGFGAPGFSLWWSIFKGIGFYYYLWGILTPLIYRLTDILPYRGPGVALSVTVHLGVLVVLSFALGLVAHWPNWHEWLLGARAAAYHAMSAFTYLLIVLCCLALKFYRLSLLRQREASAAKIQAARLDSKLNLARVDSLRMQMNPHFLFNSLNSVAALVDAGKTELAYRAIEELGDLLRRALRLSQSNEVTLAEELDFARAYLSLEELRFGDRLTVDWQIDAESKVVAVPAFVLQPLVENAIKHAVGPSAVPVTVIVRATVRDGALVLSVLDDAAKGESSRPGHGLGIANLRERLRLRYGPGATVDAHGGEEGYSAHITIPDAAGGSG